MDAALRKVESLGGRLTKFESNFKKCSAANRTEGYLEGRQVGIEALWKDICKVNELMLSLQTEQNKEDSYYEDDVFSGLEERYFAIVGQIKDQLKALKPQPQLNNVNSDQQQNNQRRNATTDNQSKVKLPKISLPEFHGSYHTWMSFKNRFSNLIHNSTTLTNVEKLDYLKSCVTGEAERTIQRFQITDQNYVLAWDRLNEKYDNQRILQDTQIETIIDRRSIKTESATELRELLDVIQECLESLNNLTVDTTGWDPMLVVLIKRKLPFKTREEWEKELNPKDVPTYKQLIEFLEKRYRTVENLELVGESSTIQRNQPKHQLSREISSKTSNQRSCIACNNERHSLTVCEIFLNMSQSNRSAFVNAKKLCRNCLAVNHTIEECGSTKRCFKCSGNHHTLLHKEDYNREEKYQNPFGQPNMNYSQNYRSQYQSHRNQSNSNQSNDELNPNAIPYTSNVNRSSTYVTRSEQDKQRQNQYHQTSQKSQMSQSSQSSQGEGNSQVNRNSTDLNEENGTNQQTKVFTTSFQMSPQAQINPIYTSESTKGTLFPTAMIKVKDDDGEIWYLRALLDQCSEDVFIKESTAKKLKLKQVPIPEADVTGLNEIVTAKINKSTKFEIVIDKNESIESNAKVVETLIEMLPTTEVKLPKNLFTNLKLADPTFAKPDKIDIMLGSKMFAYLLLDGIIKEGGYLAQNTKLGWIISGAGNEVEQPKKQTVCGFTRIISRSKKNRNNWSEKPRKYFAPQRNFNPIHQSNQKPQLMELNVSKRSEKHTIYETNLKSTNVIEESSKKSSKMSEMEVVKSGTNQFIVEAEIHQTPETCQSIETNSTVETLSGKVNQDQLAENGNLSQVNRINGESVKVIPNDFINHKSCLPPRLSLINVNVNRLRNSNQTSKLKQYWKLVTATVIKPFYKGSIVNQLNREIRILPIDEPITEAQ